jgi:hypothetical protein
MHISDSIIEKILSRNNLASAIQIEALKKEAENSDHSLQQVILDQEILDVVTLTTAFADYAHIP